MQATHILNYIMPLNISVLTLMLLCTALFVPIPYLLARKLGSWSMNEGLQNTIRYWLYFLLSVLILRVIVGIVLTASDIDLYGVNKFYPIRIAYPNYNLLHGFLYALICLGIYIWLEPIKNYITKSHLKYFLLFTFSVVVLLAFGGIHGGLIPGNAWMATAPEQLADASLNKTLADVFTTHINRILGLINPSYHAPHSSSHPAVSIAYWQIMTRYTSPFVFSVVNVLIFSLAFPIMYWALRRCFDTVTTVQSVLACLMIPAMLVYGRSDDVVYYALAMMTTALLYVAIQEKKYTLTILASILFVFAMNFSYAAIVLLPAMFLFNANMPLKQSWQYIRKIIFHLMIFFVIITISIYLEASLLKFNWLDAFKASAQHNSNSNIFSMWRHGLFARIINDRVMAICDFLIFAGPLFLYLFVFLIKERKKSISHWQINNFAFSAFLIIWLINTNGPGEVSRPWGSLFLLIGFFWLPSLFNRLNEETRLLLIKTQLAWALALQILLNFSW